MSTDSAVSTLEAADFVPPRVTEQPQKQGVIIPDDVREAIDAEIERYRDALMSQTALMAKARIEPKSIADMNDFQLGKRNARATLNR